MKRIPLITVPPMQYPDITKTNRYANPVDERGEKIGVPQSLVGIGELHLCFSLPLNSHIPDGILWMCPYHLSESSVLSKRRGASFEKRTYSS
jgi:hypothetical protein